MFNKRILIIFIAFILLFPIMSAQTAGVFESTKASLAKYGLYGFIAIMIIVLLTILLGIVAYINYQKKKWFLTVILKMPRNEGRTIVTEIAKGYWDARKATLWVKRRKIRGKKLFIKLDDIRKYLQGDNIIELEGSGVDWKPILFQSYLNLIDEETGQEASIMKYSMDFTRDKTWAIASEREYTNTFSVSDTFNKLKDYIGWGLVIGIVILAEVIRTIYLKGQ